VPIRGPNDSANHVAIAKEHLQTMRELFRRSGRRRCGHFLLSFLSLSLFVFYARIPFFNSDALECVLNTSRLSLSLYRFRARECAQNLRAFLSLSLSLSYFVY